MKAARKISGAVGADRGKRGALHRRAPRQYRIAHDRMERAAPLKLRVQITQALAPRHCRKRYGMPAPVSKPVLHAEPELLQRPEEGRIGTAKQRNEGDLLAARL